MSHFNVTVERESPDTQPTTLLRATIDAPGPFSAAQKACQPFIPDIAENSRPLTIRVFSVL